MYKYYKEKALRATKYRVESNIRQSGFFIRNLWKVIGFGILMSIWAPTQVPNNLGFKRKSAMEVSGLTYYELIVLTAVLYTFFCVLAHFIWSIQDRKQLERLLKRKQQLKNELGIKK